MSSFESRWLSYAPENKKVSEIPKKATVKTCKSLLESEEATQGAPLTLVSTEAFETPDTVPRLPWQLEALLRAASSDLLPKDTVTLPTGLVPDLNRYTLAWAASYLTGDRDEALVRLWQAHAVWARKDVN